VQQVLCQPGEVERFLPAQDADALRQCFAGLWAVGESNNDAAAAAASAAAAGRNNNHRVLCEVVVHLAAQRFTIVDTAILRTASY
jgi:Eukaryotic glutathione synthase, ATP binding domain